MPKTSKEISDREAELLADYFEAWEPDETTVWEDSPLFASLKEAALLRAQAETAVRETVARAREARYPWWLIGQVLGTTGEAARQRYGTKKAAAK